MKKILIIFFIFTSLFSCRQNIEEQYNPKSTAEQARKGEVAKFKPNEVLVTFKYWEDNYAVQAVGGSVKEKVHTKAMQHFGDKPFFILTVPDVSNAVEALKHNLNIESVSPNYIITIPPEETNSSSVNIPSVQKLQELKS